MKKVWKILSIIVIIVILFIAYKAIKGKKAKNDWKLQNVEMSSIREIVTASGTINPVTTVEVGTEVSGTIEKLYKDYNETVKKGDLLAKINTETLELNAEESKSSLLAAESSAKDAQLDVDLLRDLVKKNMAAEYDLKKAEVKNEQAIQSVNRARLAFQRAQKNLNNAFIYSPIDGVIVSRSVDEGQTVAASLNAPTLFNIANDLRKMQINASVDEADIGKIDLDMPVRFTVDAFPEESFKGKVQQVRLDPQNESNVISYTVIILINNPDMLLLPGMTANVQIIVNQKQDVLAIPARALQFKPSKEVWESFGLEWNDSLLARGKRSIFNKELASNNSNKLDSKVETKTSLTNDKSSKVNATDNKQIQDTNKSAQNEKRPRLSREEFDKLSPDERKKLREKFGKRRQQEENNEVEITTPKLNNSQSVDIFKLRKSYSGNQTQKGSVWVLENKIPKKVDVEYGISDGSRIEIISGLKEGQEVIIGVESNDSSSNNNTKSAMQFGGMGPR